MQTFKIQLLLKLFVQLLTVELGVGALKVEVAFKLDRVLLDVSWAALPSGAVPCSSVPCGETSPAGQPPPNVTEAQRTEDRAPASSPTEKRARQAELLGGSGPGSGGSGRYLIFSSGASYSRRSPALELVQWPAERHLKRRREE